MPEVSAAPPEISSGETTITLTGASARGLATPRATAPGGCGGGRHRRPPPESRLTF
jgi:hypothetical protein